MSYLEELLPEFKKGAKIRRKDWDKGKYIVCKGAFVENALGRIHSLTNTDIVGDVWEFYKEQEPEWDYIIKNKCLCWLWDEKENCKVIDTLNEVIPTVEYKFNGAFLNCRPVRRDEVTFYEDRKDER